MKNRTTVEDMRCLLREAPNARKIEIFKKAAGDVRSNHLTDVLQKWCVNCRKTHMPLCVFIVLDTASMRDLNVVRSFSQSILLSSFLMHTMTSAHICRRALRVTQVP